MTDRELHPKRKLCMDNGYRIYVIPYGSSYYKIVVAKATKYSWSDIPRDKRKNYEEVDKVIYSLKIGEILFKKKPTRADLKYYEKIDEMYLSIYEKLTTKNQ